MKGKGKMYTKKVVKKGARDGGGKGGKKGKGGGKGKGKGKGKGGEGKTTVDARYAVDTNIFLCITFQISH